MNIKKERGDRFYYARTLKRVEEDIFPCLLYERQTKSVITSNIFNVISNITLAELIPMRKNIIKEMFDKQELTTLPKAGNINLKEKFFILIYKENPT